MVLKISKGFLATGVKVFLDDCQIEYNEEDIEKCFKIFTKKLRKAGRSSREKYYSRIAAESKNEKDRYQEPVNNCLYIARDVVISSFAQANGREFKLSKDGYFHLDNLVLTTSDYFIKNIVDKVKSGTQLFPWKENVVKQNIHVDAFEENAYDNTFEDDDLELPNIEEDYYRD